MNEHFMREISRQKVEDWQAEAAASARAYRDDDTDPTTPATRHRPRRSVVVARLASLRALLGRSAWSARRP